jgi:hypothetical protein
MILPLLGPTEAQNEGRWRGALTSKMILMTYSALTMILKSLRQQSAISACRRRRYSTWLCWRKYLQFGIAASLICTSV